MFESRGQSYGEFAVAPNPPARAALYYWLKSEAEDVKLLVKDLAGEQLAELEAEGEKGLHRFDWDMRETQRAGQGARGGQQAAGRGGFGGRGRAVGPGTYTVVLMVGGQEVATQTLRIEPDPAFK